MMLGELWYRIRAFLRPRRADADLEDEIQFHHAQEQDKLVRTGHDAVSARRHSRVAFGGRSAVEEACREARGVRWLSDTLADLRYAWRGLVRNPLFAFAVTGSLVLGIGANATMFTLMRAALWRPLPVPAPHELVHVHRTADMSFSYVLFQDLKKAAEPDAIVIAKTTARQRKFGSDPASRERVTGEAVTDDFFAAMRVGAAAGRTLGPGDDDVAGGRRVAVLSHAFWVRRFGADPGVIGSTVYYEESPFTVVGVAAKGFTGIEAEKAVDLWVPVTADPAIAADWLRLSSYFWLTLFARVPVPARLPALRAGLEARFRSHLNTEILPTIPARFHAQLDGQHVELLPAPAGLSTTGRRYAEPLRLLMLIALAILLISAANVANLVRARAERRRPEFALRRALGATGSRLLRQHVLEGFALALIGTGGAILAAPSLARILVALLPQAPPAFDLRTDLVVVAATAAVGFVVGVLAIALPAWRNASTATTMGSGARVSRHFIVGKGIVATELGTVLVLLVVAGLSLTTVQRLQAIGLGFDPTSVTTVHLSFPRATNPAAAKAALENVRRALDATPGVEVSTHAFPDVYDDGGASMAIVPDGYTARPGEDTQAGTIWAGAGFFDVLRLKVTAGRVFDDRDVASSANRVVVNETFARRYFGDRTAVGQRIRIPSPGGGLVNEIVGVVNDARHYGVRSEPWMMVYFPAVSERAHLLVRSRGVRPSDASIRAAVESTGLPQVESIRPLSDAVNDIVGGERLLAFLSTTVAVVASLLAGLGLYGIVAYGVTCRVREFGVRLALGARASDIQRLILGETMKVCAIGGAAGFAAAFGAAHAMSRMISGSATLDARVLLGATMALLVVAAAAGALPAWRASRTDPAEVLRAE